MKRPNSRPDYTAPYAHEPHEVIEPRVFDDWLMYADGWVLVMGTYGFRHQGIDYQVEFYVSPGDYCAIPRQH